MQAHLLLGLHGELRIVLDGDGSMALAGRLFVKSSAGNRANNELNNSAESCVRHQMMRKKTAHAHKAGIGDQRTDNPDGEAGADCGLDSGAEARPDGGIDPDRYNAGNDPERVES